MKYRLLLSAIVLPLGIAIASLAGAAEMTVVPQSDATARAAIQQKLSELGVSASPSDIQIVPVYSNDECCSITNFRGWVKLSQGGNLVIDVTPAGQVLDSYTRDGGKVAGVPAH